MADCFLSVDIGTTRTKGIIIDHSGVIITKCENLRARYNRANNLHEDDAELDWWLEFVRIAKVLINNATNFTISGICVTGMWPNFLLTDQNGYPLHLAVLYDDPRSEEICGKLKNILGADTYGYEIIPRLIWFRQEKPDVIMRAHRFFTTHSYIIYKLTGVHSLDSHTALSLGNVLNPSTFEWKEDLFKEFDLSSKILPRVYAPSTIVGYLTKEVSKILRVAAGIPVVAGFGDSYASLISSGACNSGDTFVYSGTSGILLSLTREIEYVCSATSFPHGDEGINWILSLARSGEKLSNIVRLLGNFPFGHDMTSFYNTLDAEASKNSPGSEGIRFLFELGQRSTSVLGTELSAGIIGLHTRSCASQIYRSMLEGFSYCVRNALKSHEQVSTIFVTGGSAYSILFRNILANVLKKNVVYFDSSQGALGGALLIANSLNELDLRDYITSQNNMANITSPDNSIASIYDNLFTEYMALQNKLGQ